ncbi:MAG: biotin--[acetyl-CoA-carboxylase] ligase [Magnetococcales bacterium]|nr:biotin--[acetyl-CoA-carboxylase] ligase [Magnetococcales bacterium]
MSPDLLSLLRAAPGTALSGRDLGVRLGVSRAAIWKQVRALMRAGYCIESRHGEGYRLVGEPDVLTAEAVAPLLPATGLFLADRYHHLAAIGSTNEEAIARARAGAPAGTVVTAEHQTHGRGRLGRAWHAPPGSSLAFSILLRPPIPPHRTFQLTLLAGLALAATLHEAGFVEVTIKWPNDLLLHGRKLAGILTEMGAETDEVHYVVIGVGLNVHTTTAMLPPELRAIATGLADHRLEAGDDTGARAVPPRRKLLVAFLRHFAAWYRHYLEEGFAGVRAAWLEMARIQGRRVTVNLLKESFTGEAVDMDAEGFLLVRRKDDGSVCRVVAGDVTLV